MSKDLLQNHAEVTTWRTAWYAKQKRELAIAEQVASHTLYNVKPARRTTSREYIQVKLREMHVQDHENTCKT